MICRYVSTSQLFFVSYISKLNLQELNIFYTMSVRKFKPFLPFVNPNLSSISATEGQFALNSTPNLSSVLATEQLGALYS